MVEIIQIHNGKILNFKKTVKFFLKNWPLKNFKSALGSNPLSDRDFPSSSWGSPSHWEIFLSLGEKPEIPFPLPVHNFSCWIKRSHQFLRLLWIFFLSHSKKISITFIFLLNVYFYSFCIWGFLCEFSCHHSIFNFHVYCGFLLQLTSEPTYVHHQVLLMFEWLSFFPFSHDEHRYVCLLACLLTHLIVVEDKYARISVDSIVCSTTWRINHFSIGFWCILMYSDDDYYFQWRNWL